MPTTKALANQQRQDMLKEFPNHFAALYWSKEQLKEYRLQRLRALLTYAKTYSPWYKKSLKNINVERFTEEDLNDIPPLDKRTLMVHWDEIVTSQRLSLSLAEQHINKMNDFGDTLYLLDSYHALATSGSSGFRGVFVYEWDEWITYYIHCVRYISHRVRKSPISSEARNSKIAMVVISNTVYAMYSLAKTFSYESQDTYYIPITLPLSQIIAELNEVQPGSLLGTPTTVFKLAQEVLAGNLTIRPGAIALSGEPLYAPIRALIKEAWPRANIYNNLGSSEGMFGRNCCANSLEMHLNDDGCIVEPVDSQGNPVPKGVLSEKIYLTNLYNYTLPLIRYEMADQLLFLDKQCNCGIHHQLIAEPAGRPEFDFIYPENIFVHHLTFVTPLLLEKNIREYQVIQTNDGADIKIIPAGPIDKVRLGNTLCFALKELGVENPKINFIEISSFEYKSDKIKRFVKI